MPIEKDNLQLLQGGGEYTDHEAYRDMCLRPARHLLYLNREFDDNVEDILPRIVARSEQRAISYFVENVLDNPNGFPPSAA